MQGWNSRRLFYQEFLFPFGLWTLSIFGGSEIEDLLYSGVGGGRLKDTSWVSSGSHTLNCPGCSTSLRPDHSQEAFSVLCAMDRVKTSAPFPHRQVCLPRSWLRKHHYCRSRKQLVTQWADGWAPKVQLTAPHPMLLSLPRVPRCGVEAIPAYRLLWCLFQPPFSMLSLFLSLPFGPVLFLPFLCPHTPECSCNRTLSFPTRASPGTQIPAWRSL